MTTGGMIVMALSAGGATLFFAFCLHHVLKALELDKSAVADAGEDKDLDRETRQEESDESSGK